MNNDKKSLTFITLGDVSKEIENNGHTRDQAFNNVLNLIFKYKNFLANRISLYLESVKFDEKNSAQKEICDVKNLINILSVGDTLKASLKNFEKLNKKYTHGNQEAFRSYKIPRELVAEMFEKEKILMSENMKITHTLSSIIKYNFEPDYIYWIAKEELTKIEIACLLCDLNPDFLIKISNKENNFRFPEGYENKIMEKLKIINTWKLSDVSINSYVNKLILNDVDFSIKFWEEIKARAIKSNDDLSNIYPHIQKRIQREEIENKSGSPFNQLSEIFKKTIHSAINFSKPNYQHWMAMEKLTPAEVACLMCELDPKFTSCKYNAIQNKNMIETPDGYQNEVNEKFEIIDTWQTQDVSPYYYMNKILLNNMSFPIKLWESIEIKFLKESSNDKDLLLKYPEIAKKLNLSTKKFEKPILENEKTYLNIIAALTILYWEKRKKPTEKINQSTIIAEIADKFPNIRGLSKRNLEKYLPMALEAFNKARQDAKRNAETLSVG
jgi:hypothetical protein